MPIITLDLDQSLPQKEFYALMYAQVAVVMAYPNSLDERKKAVHAFASNRLAARCNLPIILDNANPVFKYDFPRDTQKGGQVAGQVLNWILGLYDNPITREKASVGLALHIVTEERRLEVALADGQESSAYPEPRTIKKAWHKFKSVAHFWAQNNMVVSYKEKSCKTIHDFMVAAEMRRRLCETLKNLRASKPVLDAAATWKLPHPIPLWQNDIPSQVQIRVPIIDPDYEKFIAAYNSDADRGQ